jgi:hypothetical protein
VLHLLGHDLDLHLGDHGPDLARLIAAGPDLVVRREGHHAALELVLHRRVHVDALYAAAQKAVETYNAQIKTRLEPFGVDIKLMNPEEYKTWLKGQSALFSGILKSMGN